jgi:hypothetical protein
LTHTLLLKMAIKFVKNVIDTVMYLSRMTMLIDGQEEPTQIQRAKLVGIVNVKNVGELKILVRSQSWLLSLAANGRVLAEVGAFRVETVRLPQKHHRSRNVDDTTNAPILANTCYQQPFFRSNF